MNLNKIKTLAEVEEILKEFHEEVLIDMSLNNIISDTQEKWITNFFRKALLTTRKRGKEEIIKNHYCCKYQTIDPEDFCDECLIFIQDNEK